MTERIRITGGARRNKRLLSPPKNTIRPASDMIRQAVFNMLGDTIRGRTFYDVFAGTGVVGIEALSRGADKAIFLELDRKFVGLIRKNLALAQMETQAAVRTGDAFLWGKHFAPEPAPLMVFLGPPYPLFDGAGKQKVFALVREVMGKLRADDWLILQMPKEVLAEELPDAEHWVRVRHYGKTRVGIWKPDGAPGDPIWTMGGDEEAGEQPDEELAEGDDFGDEPDDDADDE